MPELNKSPVESPVVDPKTQLMTLKWRQYFDQFQRFAGLAMPDGSAGKLLAVNAAETGLEAATIVQTVTGSVTLTAARHQTLLSTPTAAYTQVLPTTGVLKNDRVQVKNLASTNGYNITLNSSGGNLVWLVCPGNECELIALENTPTTAAQWAVLNRGWPIAARVHKSADQTNVTESTTTVVTFNTVARDPAGLFVDANDKLVFPLPGSWEVEAQLMIEGDIGLGMRVVLFFNAAEAATSGVDYIEPSTVANRATARPKGIVNVTVPGTDYVDLRVSYAGAGVDIGDIAEADGSFTTTKATWLSARYLGPL